MTRRSRAALGALLVSLAVGCPSSTPVDEAVEVPDIENFSQLEGESGFAGSPVGFGGATDPSAMPWLKSQGFATVVNLRLASEAGAEVEASRAAAEAAGLDYVHLPFDAREPDPRVVERVLAAAGEDANRPVYIHCGSATRAAAVWMVGRVLEDGWTFEAAEAEAREIAGRPDVAAALARRVLSARESSPP